MYNYRFADYKTRSYSADYDAVVVGSGPGGSAVALRLAERGARVLLLEKGSFLYFKKTFEGEDDGKFITHIVRDRQVPLEYIGGQSKFYGAALYRLREMDFEGRETEAGTIPRWPIGYRDLEPYYGQAERIYKVHGAPEGDPTEPQRSEPYPHPALPHAPVVRQLVERIRKTGTGVSPIPKGLDFGSGRPCSLCPTCDAHYCRLDAKMDAEIAAVRPAVETGNVDLLTGADVERVLMSDDGRRAVGVRFTQAGEVREIMADAVVLACGHKETPALLHRSATAARPSGPGNSGGALGRYMAGHSVGMIFPLVSLGPVPRAHTKTFAINQFYAGAEDWAFPLGTIQVAGQMPFWEEASRVMRLPAYLVGTRSLLSFYMSESVPTPHSGFMLKDGRAEGYSEPTHALNTFNKLREKAVDVFRRAGYRTVARKRPPYSWHEVGTARMGEDERDSVVDPDCGVHGCAGLYVSDASVLPSAGAVNTGLTIVALGLRLADHIAKSLGDAPAARASIAGQEAG